MCETTMSSSGRIRSTNALSPAAIVCGEPTIDTAGAVSFVGHYDLALTAVPDGTRLRLGLRITETAVAAVPYIAGIETGWAQVLDNLADALTDDKERR